ncbi:hypothetical protein LGV61_03730 [Desulfurispirillum indicum]|uniref:Type IV pilus assembly PilZ n=1 Tax=Desulfurispirillum indicum (strain ATCC BAA-1389 / DSM 22839 / S5) TaxID=653733 RepID=E6W1U9_DESIS|nr:hypothetical protein [Desulfurispirillum indicum]ADU65481.1 hypothetical protein Selin_0737 [Desulfurispirillum indicum S5]UCZ57401.1 hypothetical protein LGV61_03730 [Desulfurispirillum indicum]
MLSPGTQIELALRTVQGLELWCSATVDKVSESVVLVRLNTQIAMDYGNISSSEDYPVTVNVIDGEVLVTQEGRIAGKLRDEVYGIRLVGEATRHEYTSIEDRIKVHYKPLSEQEYYATRPEMRSYRTPQPNMPKYLDANDDIPQSLMKFIGDINYKLDRILNLLESHSSEKLVIKDFFHTSRVGGGFLIGEKGEVGSAYLLQIKIPIYPYHEFYAIGKGVPFSGGATGILFTYISEDDREELIKYVFERQREILKSKRKQ